VKEGESKLLKGDEEENTDGQVADEDEFVANSEPPVNLCRSTVHDFRYVDAVITGDVLIARSARNAETEPFIAFAQFNLDDSRRTRCPTSPNALYNLKKSYLNSFKQLK